MHKETLEPQQVVRAWKNIEYYENLDEALKLQMPVNPVGNIDWRGAVPHWNSNLVYYLGTQSTSCNTQSTVCNTQSTSCNTQSTSCNTQSTSCNTQSTSCNTQDTSCNTQSTSCNTQDSCCGAPPGECYDF